MPVTFLLSPAGVKSREASAGYVGVREDRLRRKRHAQRLLRQRRCSHPDETRDERLDAVGAILAVAPRTVAEYEREDSGFSGTVVPLSDDEFVASIHYWWDRFGEPSKIDWTPCQVRAKDHANCAERLERYEGGWEDPRQAEPRAYPSGQSRRFPVLLERARWERAIGLRPDLTLPDHIEPAGGYGARSWPWRPSSDR